MLLNAAECFSFHSNFFFDVGDDSRGLSGADSVADFGMNLIRWWMLPMNDRNCLSVFGLSNWIIASVFLFVGFIPSAFILYPS